MCWRDMDRGGEGWCVVKCGEGRGGVVCWREMGGEGWWV